MITASDYSTLGLFVTLLTRFLACFAIAISLGYTQSLGPVGLITEAAGTSIVRSGSRTVLPAYPGDLLFDGDVLQRPASGRVTFAFCPASVSYVAGEGEIGISRTRVTLNKKVLAVTNTLRICRLPYVTIQTQRDVRTAADRIQTAPSSEGTQTRPAVTLTPEQTAAIQPLNDALRQNPKDLVTLLAHAIALEAAGDFDGAVNDYKTFVSSAPQAHWALDEMRALLAQRDRVASGGKVIGVVIGISEYQHLGPDRQLLYADRDAEYFYDSLLSLRGGARAADVTLLLNGLAKLGDMQTAIAGAFARAKRNDSVVLFIAAHGEPGKDGVGAYIMAYDSDPESMDSTAFRMEDLHDVSEGKLRPQGIQMYIDSCNAAGIDYVRDPRLERLLTKFLDQDRPSNQVLGFLASGPKEPSYECSNFDDGHGAFTYFLVHGLNAVAGKAVDEDRGQITVESLVEYVRQSVRTATKSQDQHQTPEKRGNIDDRVEIVKKSLSGLAMRDTQLAPAACESARGRGVRAPREPRVPNSDLPAAFAKALAEGRILPSQRDSAFAQLKALQTTASPEMFIAARTRLLAALINEGQAILLQYLKGEQVPMTRDEFARGEDLFTAAAQLLDGGDSFIEGRRAFFRGRRLVFEKRLDEAVSSLKEAIRLDLLGSYSYNALGIAFLESAHFELAIQAFQDAVHLSPAWAYAWHNLALAYAEAGQYAPAIAAYQQGARLGSQYAYIPYNLGLLYERLNRPDEARSAWNAALQAAPSMARAKVAIGLSYFAQRRFKKAEDAYRTALTMAQSKTDRLTAQHDLALLLMARHEPTEALSLWRANLKQDENDVPSLIGLSNALAELGQTEEAAKIFSTLIAKQPDYLGGRMRFAKMLADSGKKDQAATQLRELLVRSPENAEALETLGDLLSPARTSKPSTEAVDLYRRALQHATSDAQRKRLSRKLRSS